MLPVSAMRRNPTKNRFRKYKYKYAVKSKTWWAGIDTLTYSRSYHVCVTLLAHLHVSEQSSVMRNMSHNLHKITLVSFPCNFPFPLIHSPNSLAQQCSTCFFWVFLPNKLTPCPFSGVSLFGFSFQHQFAHQDIMKIQQYFLVGTLH